MGLAFSTDFHAWYSKLSGLAARCLKQNARTLSCKLTKNVSLGLYRSKQIFHKPETAYKQQARGKDLHLLTLSGLLHTDTR